MKTSELGQFLSTMVEQASHYEPCMSLVVSEDGQSVELLLETNISSYLQWIPGEGADIGLIRCQDTKKVVGVHLPLMNNKLAVFHKGPLRINDGFLKDES